MKGGKAGEQLGPVWDNTNAISLLQWICTQSSLSMSEKGHATSLVDITVDVHRVAGIVIGQPLLGLTQVR